MNEEGRYLDLPAVVPLDEESLLTHACRSTGLEDFGDAGWQEPFSVLLRALEEEADLTLMGRLMARNDLLIFMATLMVVAFIMESAACFATGVRTVHNMFRRRYMASQAEEEEEEGFTEVF